MLPSTFYAAVAMLAISQAASVSANHYKPRIEEGLQARSNPFSAHSARPRDAFHRSGSSLRKRCTRKSSSQIAISSDSGDNEDSGSSSTDGNEDDDGSSSSSSSSSKGTSVAKASSSNSTAHSGSWLKKNCVTWGWITDDGDHSHGSTGSLETPAQINSAVGTDALYFGAYAHIQGDEYKKGDSSTYFDGSEIIPYVDYLKGTGAIAVLSVMPVYGWGGLTSDDNTQALQTVKVLKEFTDAGIEVYLRFGHEMNWYTQPNSDDAQSGKSYYSGGGSEYIEGWKTMAAAVKSELPDVKMFWCPNIGSASDYAKFWPGADTVDIVGVDYYPHGDYSDLASHVQGIHDTYAKANDIPFHLGETGSTAGDSVKEQWVKTLTSEDTCNKLSHFEASHWFNYDKGGDFRVAEPNAAGMTSTFVKLME